MVDNFIRSESKERSNELHIESSRHKTEGGCFVHGYGKWVQQNWKKRAYCGEKRWDVADHRTNCFTGLDVDVRKRLTDMIKWLDTSHVSNTSKICRYWWVTSLADIVIWHCVDKITHSHCTISNGRKIRRNYIDCWNKIKVEENINIWTTSTWTVTQ